MSVEDQAATERKRALALVSSYRLTQALKVMADLRLADVLSAGPRSADELAATAGCHPRSLRRLLRALVAAGALTQAGDRFGLTPLGEQFRDDRLGPAARFFGSEVEWAAFARLDHSVRTGERAFDLVHGKRNWEHWASSPEAGNLFDRAMHSMTGPIARGVVAAWDFSRYRTVADIGGGDGTLLVEILQANPDVAGILFDLPHVIERARPGLAASGLGDRIQVRSGSFLDEVPSGADAYVLKNVIHDWEDADAAVILESCRRAASPGTNLLLVERVISERPTSADLEMLLLDLLMLTITGGLERTEAEFRTLLEGAGFRLEQVVATAFPHSVLQAIAV